MTINKDYIDEIAKVNEFNKVDFDSWIAFEQRIMMTNFLGTIEEHQDIVTILEHLRNVYEKGVKEPIHIKSKLEDVIKTAHYQAQDLRHKHENFKASLEDFNWAYDIYHLLRDTRFYIYNQLAYVVMNKYYE